MDRRGPGDKDDAGLLAGGPEDLGAFYRRHESAIDSPLVGTIRVHTP